MGMNNYVKDGLDAYLALTGEHRAENKAKADTEYQRKGMELAINQDVRAATSAKLANDMSALQIEEARRNDEERANEPERLKKALFASEQRAKPTSVDDTEGIARVEQEVADHLGVAHELAQLPVGYRAAHDVSEMSERAQRTIMNGPYEAAKSRKGDTHTDPATGKEYTMLGTLGKVYVEKGADGIARVTPTMLAQSDGGDPFEVPYTRDRTNNPDNPITQLTSHDIADRALTDGAAIQRAKENNTSIAEEAAKIKFDRIMALPYPQRVTLLSELEKKNIEKDEASIKTKAAAASLEKQLPSMNQAQQLQTKTAIAFLKSGEAKSVKEAVELASLVKPAKQGISLPEGTIYIDLVSGETLAKNPKVPEYKSRTRQEGTKEVFEESQDNGRTWARVSDGPKFNPRGDSNGSSLDKRDIAVRLRDAQRGYQNAMKTGDPDMINEAVGFIESLNVDARQFGVTPMPVPPRPFSTAENEAIKAQAVKNLEQQRTGIPKFFGTKPNVIAINQEVRRIKQTVKPGNVSFGEPQAQPTQPATAAHAMPPAAQHKGRIIRDTDTGKRYQSTGAGWAEVR